MSDHVRILGIVSLGRALLEVLVGVYLILVHRTWFPRPDGIWPTWPPTHYPNAEPLAGDRDAFLVLGVVLLCFAVARSIQAICALGRQGWCRRFGIVLAICDFATPLTLPLAFWGIAVYQHTDTRDWFRRTAA